MTALTLAGVRAEHARLHEAVRTHRRRCLTYRELRFCERCRYLERAAIRWISAEPLLGPLPSLDLAGIDWLVTGGESGPGARLMDPTWVRDLRDRADLASVALFHKQMGSVWARAHGGGKGGDPATWPADLRIRAYPQEEARHA